MSTQAQIKLAMFGGIDVDGIIENPGDDIAPATDFQAQADIFYQACDSDLSPTVPTRFPSYADADELQTDYVAQTIDLADAGYADNRRVREYYIKSDADVAVTLGETGGFKIKMIVLYTHPHINDSFCSMSNEVEHPFETY